MTDTPVPVDPNPAELDGVPDATIDLEYAGQTYTLPASADDCDGDVIDAIDEAKVSRAIRGLLGADDWARFKATKPKVRDYNGLLEAWAERVGIASTGN